MKFHIITEDEGSGKIFWECINDQFLSSKANIIVARGVTNLDKKLRENYKAKIINFGDCVMIAFDNTGTLQASAQMEKLNKHATEYELNLFFTTYYCFEEIFLSFEYLIDWINPKMKLNEKAFIDFVRCSILNNQDYLLDHTLFERERV